MTTIFDAYQLVQFILDKDRNGFASPADVSKALEVGQQTVYDRYYAFNYGENQASVEALRPFVKVVPQTASATGLLTVPADFVHVLSINSTDDATVYEPVLQVELSDTIKSVLYPIAEWPKYMAISSGLQLYPKTYADVSLHYLARPVAPVVGVTVTGNQETYDPNTSVQLGFDNKYWVEIIAASLPYLGVNLSDEQVVGLSGVYNQMTKKP